VISKAIKVFIVVVTIGVAIYYCYFYAQEVSKLITYGQSGYVESNIITNADSSLMFSRVDTADFTAPPYPSAGDTLLTINDSAATNDALNREFNSPHPAGYEVAIGYRSGQDTLRAVARLQPMPRRTLAIQTVLMFLRFLISVCFFAVGLWAFIKRPDAGAVRALTLFCYAMGAFLMTVVSMIADSYSAISTLHGRHYSGR
jgi:hypothetical protein